VAAYRLGLIGAGNMAEAIVRGALTAPTPVGAASISVADPSPARRKVFAEELGVAALEDNGAVIKRSDLVVLAVKPQVLDDVLSGVGPLLGSEKLVVSIAAGVPIERIARRCADRARIIRAMPNTPMLVGRGMVALSRGPAADDDDARRVRELFGACAAVIEVTETKMDAVTAVSGSGPAYFFYLVEALIEAGVTAGLNRDEAVAMAETTFVGAAELLASGDWPAAELRRRVTSPGGTTAAAISSFESDEFLNMVGRAVRAAAERSRELGG